MNSITSNTKPFISVIIATYNGVNRIKRLLDSLYNQVFDDFEVIVVDDHSNDGVDRIAAEYRKDNLIFIEKVGPRGPYLSRQQGLAKARGLYVVCMDDDDYVDEGYFRSLFVSVKNAKEQPTALITAVHIVDENGKLLSIDGKLEGTSNNFASSRKMEDLNAFRSLLSCRYGSWRLVFRRDYLLSSGYDFEAGELPLFARLFNDDCHSYFVPGAVYNYVQRTESISHDLGKSASFNSVNSSNRTFEFNDKIALNCLGRKRKMAEAYILKSLYPPYLIRGLNDDDFKRTKAELKHLKKVYHYHFFAMLRCLPYFSKRTWKSCFIIMFALDRIAWLMLKKKLGN